MGITSTSDPVCGKTSHERQNNSFNRIVAVQYQMWGLSEGSTWIMFDKRELIKNLKKVHRCGDASEKKYIRAELNRVLGSYGLQLWNTSMKPFSGYTVLYPDYTKSFYETKRYLIDLGITETDRIKSFRRGSNAVMMNRAERLSKQYENQLQLPQILFFRAHHLGEYRAAGVFLNNDENRIIDLTFIKKSKQFNNVKLIIGTSCAMLCNQPLDLFTRLFPEATILGYRKASPAGDPLYRQFKAKMLNLNKPLFLDHDIDLIVNAWKKVVESLFPKGTYRNPGIFRKDTKKGQYWSKSGQWKGFTHGTSDNNCRRLG